MGEIVHSKSPNFYVLILKFTHVNTWETLAGGKIVHSKSPNFYVLILKSRSRVQTRNFNMGKIVHSKIKFLRFHFKIQLTCTNEEF